MGYVDDETLLNDEYVRSGKYEIEITSDRFEAGDYSDLPTNLKAKTFIPRKSVNYLGFSCRQQFIGCNCCSLCS